MPLTAATVGTGCTGGSPTGAETVPVWGGGKETVILRLSVSCGGTGGIGVVTTGLSGLSDVFNNSGPNMTARLVKIAAPIKRCLNRLSKLQISAGHITENAGFPSESNHNSAWATV